VIVAVVEMDAFALLVAVSVHVPGVAGAVHVVFALLAVLVGLKVPQVAVQFMDVSTALVTVACAVAVSPTLTVLALFAIALIATVLGVTTTELSTKFPAALVALSQ
jgi:hypothetical protein